jgi:hypothetical protein
VVDVALLSGGAGGDGDGRKRRDDGCSHCRSPGWLIFDSVSREG